MANVFQVVLASRSQPAFVFSKVPHSLCHITSAGSTPCNDVVCSKWTRLRASKLDSVHQFCHIQGMHGFRQLSELRKCWIESARCSSWGVFVSIPLTCFYAFVAHIEIPCCSNPSMAGMCSSQKYRMHVLLCFLFRSNLSIGFQVLRSEARQFVISRKR